jgi:integrase
MRWPDLDLDALTWQPDLQVKRQRDARDPETGKRKGKLIAAPLKTEASGQKVAIPASARAALAAWQTEQKKMRLAAPRWADLGLVFTTGLGTALEPRNVNRAWERVCGRAGTLAVRLHDLRHACASFLQMGRVASGATFPGERESRRAATQRTGHSRRTKRWRQRSADDLRCHQPVPSDATMLHPVRLHRLPA